MYINDQTNIIPGVYQVDNSDNNNWLLIKTSLLPNNVNLDLNIYWRMNEIVIDKKSLSSQLTTINKNELLQLDITIENILNKNNINLLKDTDNKYYYKISFIY